MEFNNYLEKIRPLICQELQKTQTKIKRYIIESLYRRTKNTYYQIQIATMTNGKIWEIVFFNFQDWERMGNLIHVKLL